MEGSQHNSGDAHIDKYTYRNEQYREHEHVHRERQRTSTNVNE
jgi:hypothetical protein